MNRFQDAFIRLASSFTRVRDMDEVLEHLLHQMRTMLRADAGSIFIYDDEADRLIFRYTQNDSIDLPFKEFSIPVDEKSIAGYVALKKEPLRIDDVYEIGDSMPFNFNPSFDDMSGYRSKSVLAFPFMDANGNLTGVLQLWNRKKRDIKITKKNAASTVAVFSDADERLVQQINGVVSLAVENAMLYQNIEGMWEGFIRASVHAIESRDPVTRGHTERVTAISLGLAEAMHEDDGTFQSFRMSGLDRKAFQYACLLHDFGKIGVREHVLLKAKKLYPGMLDTINYRIQMAKAMAMLRGADRSEIRFLDDCWECVTAANEPNVLEGDVSEMLGKCKGYQFTDIDDKKHNLLTEREYEMLSIKRGSLTPKERDEIQSHVQHTYDFLMMIPWTKDLRNVPAIAAMHHEKLDGTGYPFGLEEAKIHILGRVMAVADIFDALTAKDRPYKRAVPVEKACAILTDEAGQGKLDVDIVSFFVNEKIYEDVEYID